MTSHVAFLRAVNVAGHAKVTKDELKAAFSAAGCEDVQTYIQSGNVIYRAPTKGRSALVTKIRAQLKPLIGEAVVIVRTLQRLQDLLKKDPFREIDRSRDIKLYLALLASDPSEWPALPLTDPKESLEVVDRDADDVFIVSGKKPNGFYGFPNAVIEKTLDVPATSRNWNTISKIVEKFG